MRTLAAKDSSPLYRLPSTKQIYPKKMPKFVTLANGLRIIVEEMPKRNKTSVRIFVGSGAAEESIQGLAHFTEHVAFNGTHLKTEKQLAAAFEAVGAKENASTDRFETIFESDLLGKDVMVPIELFLDMLFNPASARVNREKSIILNEIDLDNEECSDQIRQLERLERSAWKENSAYNHILGTKETVTSIKRKNVENYFADFYTPDNVVISVAGDCNADEIISGIERLTKHLKGTHKKVTPPALELDPGVYVGRSASYPSTDLVFSCVSPGNNDVLSQYTNCAVSDVASWRLHDRLRRQKGLTYAVESDYEITPIGNQFSISTNVSNKDFDIALKILLDEIQKLKKHGLRPDEIEKISVNLLRELLLEMDNPEYRAEFNGRTVLTKGKFLLLTEKLDPITTITNEVVLDAVNRIFTRANVAFLAVGGRSLPKKEVLEERVNVGLGA